MEILTRTDTEGVIDITFTLDLEDYQARDRHLHKEGRILKASSQCAGCYSNHLKGEPNRKIINYCRISGMYCSLCNSQVNSRALATGSYKRIENL